MPASPEFPAEYLAACYERRTAGIGWTRMSASQYGANAQQLRRAVVRWAAENGRPDPCNRRTARATERFARRSVTVETAASLDLTFGIEIEFRRPSGYGVAPLDPETIAEALTAAGVPCRAETYNHQTRRQWKLISDASSDRELVSPILRGEDGLRQVRDAMRVLRSLGCRVSSSEGMHVHIGASHLTAMQACQVAEGYARNRHLFDAVVARSRRAAEQEGRGGYCCPLREDTLRSIRRTAADFPTRLATETLAGRTPRYSTVNFVALGAHGTIEFRQHQGSLNGTKATAWVRLLLGFFTAATAGDVPQYGTVREMAEAFGVAAPSVDFLVSRVGEVASAPTFPAAPVAPASAPAPVPGFDGTFQVGDEVLRDGGMRDTVSMAACCSNGDGTWTVGMALGGCRNARDLTFVRRPAMAVAS